MKKLMAASALVLGCWAGVAQAGPVVTFNGGSGATPTGLTVIQNYDSYAPGASIGGTNAYAYNTNTDMGTTAKEPSYGSTGNYAAVLAGGSYTISFLPTSAVAFVLGTLDTYNHLRITYADTTFTDLTGLQIITGLTGGATTVPNGGTPNDPTTNGEVEYAVNSGPLISSLTFSSDRNAFEFDNVATAPEPAAWAMMILGLGLVGGVLRRRPTAKVKFA